jgi:hypothetical protein
MDAFPGGSSSEFLALTPIQRFEAQKNSRDWSDSKDQLLDDSGLTPDEVSRDDLFWFVATEIDRITGRSPDDGSMVGLLQRIRWADLVWSLAFERQPGRRAPGAPDRDPLNARRAYSDFFVNHLDVVTSRVHARLRRGDVDSDACISDAWQGLEASYWKPEATGRFLGRCSLVSLWTQSALRRAYKQAKTLDNQARKFQKWLQDHQIVAPKLAEISVDDSDFSPDGRPSQTWWIDPSLAHGLRLALRDPSLLNQCRVTPGMLGCLMDRHGLFPILEESIATLPPARRRYALAYHRGLSNSQVAIRYNVSKVAISVALQSAWHDLGQASPLLDALRQIECSPLT